MHSNQRAIFVCFILSASLIAVTLNGRVVRGHHGLTLFDHITTRLGSVLYTAPFSINGAEASVTVIRARPDDPALLACADILGDRASTNHHLIRAGERTFGSQRVRVLAWPGVEAGWTTLIAVERNHHPIDDTAWPVVRGLSAQYSKASIRGVFRNLDSRLLSCVADTLDTPGQVLVYYEQLLNGDGWMPLFKAPSASGSGGLRGFTKERDLFLVASRRMESDGITRITLIHKQADGMTGMGDR